MEERKFNIEIYDKCDWFIELAGVDDLSNYPSFSGTIDYSFAKSRSTKDKKIAYLFDIDVRDDDLQKAQDDERFKEICEFKHDKHSFKGTFIDALEYIKKELDNE